MNKGRCFSRFLWKWQNVIVLNNNGFVLMSILFNSVVEHIQKDCDHFNRKQMWIILRIWIWVSDTQIYSYWPVKNITCSQMWKVNLTSIQVTRWAINMHLTQLYTLVCAEALHIALLIETWSRWVTAAHGYMGKMWICVDSSLPDDWVE